MTPSSPQEDLPVIEALGGSEYTLDILSQVTGISTQTILLYHEHGIIRPSSENGTQYDDDAVRILRRIEHLRDTCEMNLSGLKVLANLLEEVEKLRLELRARR